MRKIGSSLSTEMGAWRFFAVFLTQFNLVGAKRDSPDVPFSDPILIQ